LNVSGELSCIPMIGVAGAPASHTRAKVHRSIAPLEGLLCRIACHGSPHYGRLTKACRRLYRHLEFLYSQYCVVQSRRCCIGCGWRNSDASDENSYATGTTNMFQYRNADGAERSPTDMDLQLLKKCISHYMNLPDILPCVFHDEVLKIDSVFVPRIRNKRCGKHPTVDSMRRSSIITSRSSLLP
jgi:hypothetical protein